jgi:hypothetical protein
MGDAARGPRSGKDNPKGDSALIELAREAGRLHDPVIRQELAQVTAYKVLNRLNNARAKADMAQGTSSAIMSLGKLAMSRILHEEARLRTKLLGASSLLEGPDYPRAEDANFLDWRRYGPDPAQHHRRARAGPAKRARNRSRNAFPRRAKRLRFKGSGHSISARPSGEIARQGKQLGSA